jgi:uncharacterized protein YndB with AHSA1/START domain
MCKTIKQKVKFKASPEAVYRVLTDAKRHALLTGESAKIARKVGGAFSTRAGRVRGILVDLVPGKRVVQAWRSREFPEGVFSMAAFELTRQKDGGTLLVLTHRGVPKDLIPQIEADWRATYWANLRKLERG